MRKSENLMITSDFFKFLTKFFEIVSNDIMRNSDIFMRFSDFLMISSEHNKSR